MLLVLAALLVPAATARAADSPEQQLAAKYAPITELKAQTEPCDNVGEQFEPAPVSIVLGNPAVTLLRGPTAGQSAFTALATAPIAAQVAGLGGSYYLDLPGDPLHPGCTYETASRELMQTRNPTTYAHVVSEPGVQGIALQYWFFYYFNQFNDLHEGDWEMIQLAWDGAGSVGEALDRAPDRIGLAQHGGGEIASWSSTKLQKEGDHPVVYPASGSHATYYDQALYLGTGQNGSGFGCDNTTGPSRRVAPEPVVVPSSDDAAGAFAWLSYEGKWGQYEPGLNNGPDGPAQHSQWREPFRWMDGLRSSSPTVPLGATFGPSVTGAFCSVVEKGSATYNYLSQTPGLVLLVLVLIALLVLFLARRTRWAPASVTPLDQRRRARQIVTSAARLYNGRGPELLALGALFVPLSLLSAAVQRLVFGSGFVEAWRSATASPAASAAIALIVGSFATAIAYTVVVALVSVIVRDDLAGRPQSWRSVYRAVARRLWPLLATQLLVIGILLVLCVTIVGLPYAFKKAVDWVFTPWEVVVESRSGRAALRGSTGRVRGAWLTTAAVSTVVVATTVALGPVIGFILIFTTGMPLSVINIVGSIAYALAVPYTATVLCLLLLEGASGRGRSA